MLRARICIIGNGAFANKVHYPSLFSFADVDVVGVFAFDEVRLRETALKYHIPADNVYPMSSADDYQQTLLRLRPDGVYVIGQPDKMFDIWMWCLNNKFNLYIEKPPGLTLHQASMLAHMAKENGCITQVSFQRRVSPILVELKNKCINPGPITHAIVEFSKYEIKPMLGSRDRMFDDFIHCVDTARWICGGEVVKVQSLCRRIMTPDINWIGAMLYFDNGSTCYTVGNWSSGRRVFRVSMHSPGICADVEPEKEGYLYAYGNYEGERYDAREVAGSDEFFVYGGFRQKSREFIDSIMSGVEKTSSPFSDALKTMQVCESILAQYTLANFNNE